MRWICNQFILLMADNVVIDDYDLHNGEMPFFGLVAV